MDCNQDPVGGTNSSFFLVPLTMRMFLLAIAILAVVAAAGASLFLNLRAKRNYARLRDEVAQNSPSVKSMDETIKALLAEVTQKWDKVDSQVDGTFSKGLKLIGLCPTVEGLVEVCAYKMPEYSFVSPSQNKRAALLGFSQLTIFAPSTDKSLHVSDDGHLAVMQCGKDCVFVFSDEQGCLSETLYRSKRTSIEPEKELKELDTPTRHGIIKGTGAYIE
jgi:hypothetical protein